MKEMWPGVVEAAEILLYLCGCCCRVAPAGDLGLVDTVARGELQFFVPGVDLELIGSSRSGGGVDIPRKRSSMTQDERWNTRYNEVKSFVEEYHRNPSKYVGEERNMYTFVKHCRKQMNQGLLKEERVEVFKELLEVMERFKRKNQYR